MNSEQLKSVAKYAAMVGSVLPSAIPELENVLRRFMAQEGLNPANAPSIRVQVKSVDDEIDAMLDAGK